MAERRVRRRPIGTITDPVWTFDAIGG